MEMRRCGTSEIMLSVLGIGCWSFGGGDYWGRQEDGVESEIVAIALDRGVNYFDTAPSYNEGRSEVALGRALRGRRQEAIIGTKVGPEDCASPHRLRQACEESLKRLGTDTIDIYMVHWPVVDRLAEQVFVTLSALQREGKVRAVGVSNHGVRQMSQAIASGGSIQCNELCYNLLCRAVETEVLSFCAKKGIGVLSYMPLMQGLLTGRYASADDVPVSRARTRHFGYGRPGVRHGEPGAERETFAAIRAIGELAAEGRVAVEAVSLAWVRARSEITTVVLGVRTPAQLEQDMRAFEIRLTPAVVARLNSATQPLLQKLGPSPDYYESLAKSRIF